LNLNPDLDATKHQSICSSVEDALKNFDKNELFDLIICDPPSSSSDGKKVSRSISAYKELLPKLSSQCGSGGHLVLFLNTHQITRKKFIGDIENIIKERKLPLEIKKRLKMQEDCLSLPGFPEGDYLKGIVLKKTN